MMYKLLLIWLIPILINILVDTRGIKPHYFQTFIARGFAAVLHGGLIMDITEWNGYALVVFIFQLTSYWILFEVGLNLWRGKPLLYYDTVEKDSGWIDRFFAWAGKKAHVYAKVLCFIIMILSIVVLCSSEF